ncbi:sensor histidine kinase [Gorillibacterium timonense]|uniref:sensor histidine kinase n=1 Tax=Gorillibacterium timonense TaxID=1689269 RepID=UPI00071C3549|nr:HAMP domain-containing sensor histidine kinase [Gorillibacterium timonense]
MIRRINNSLVAKIFLTIAVVLFVVSFILYGIMMAVMPVSYRNLATSNYTVQISQLTSKLESGTLEDAIPKIYDFCIVNSAVAILSGNGTEMSFGGNSIKEYRDDNPTQTTTISLHFSGTSENYLLSISIASNTADQIKQTFLKLLPIIAGIILIISAIAAFFCSRFLSKPIIEISNSSKRMTALDMTWRCKIRRSDEIGSLASNLNTMAEKLNNTLEELKSANERLKGDIERERQQEKQRVDFFRAVSHELKTPITVLKGELEGMIYAVGDYKDRDTYLKHSMGTVLEMEHLLKEIMAASRMAADDLTSSLSTINDGQLITNCCRKLQGLAEDKEMTFIYEIENPFLYRGDEAMLKKAFSNIISNAVSHSPTGAAITVSFKDGLFRAENTGVQINQSDLRQIYQPFYRVEQSHNRNTGGSGLGLYIVKTVFDQHGLPYKIENTDKGVHFIVSLRNNIA